mmetsp:Transcript_28555/g.40391  ORF Transcript_28555/g.40391 Transcript_28555/m.40391 type:complete len:140 (-) Transcript_28555:25-444(-)
MPFPDVDDPLLADAYLTTTRLSQHHQGMYMATREQLLGWKDTCDCFANPMKLHFAYFRENLSSVCIYKLCQVTQVIPKGSFQDFSVHHMPNKYLSMPKVAENALHGSLLNIMTQSTKSQVALKGKNGFVIEFDTPVVST